MISNVKTYNAVESHIKWIIDEDDDFTIVEKEILAATHGRKTFTIKNVSDISDVVKAINDASVEVTE